MSEDTANVVSVFTEEIERLFDMGWEELKVAVSAAPGVYPSATDLVARHGGLIESQRVLERAEEDLLDALEKQSTPVDEVTVGLAFRVNDAVAARDDYAMAVRHLLDPHAVGPRTVAASSRTRGVRRAPEPSTPAPLAAGETRSRRAGR